MDVAGSAVGIASVGIQVCQGLLSYYYHWKQYKPDIRRAYDSIANLSKALALLRDSLHNGHVEQARKEYVEINIESCADNLKTLKKKLAKLKADDKSHSLGHIVHAGLQRACYPFRESTLTKLRETADNACDRLTLALQALQLDIDIDSQRVLYRLDTRATAIEASVTDVSARLLCVQQSDQLQRIVAWLAAPDPWANHNSARQLHEHSTGQWLLDLEYYQRWRAGATRHFWLQGKAGCGKTVLCSTVIEDIKEYCKSRPKTCCAIFYFSFSDKQKQSYESLLRSLLVQLEWKEPGLSMLQRMYKDTQWGRPGPDNFKLTQVLLSFIQSYDEVFLLLDALDECPEDSDIRQKVLKSLEYLSSQTSNIRILATSRDVPDIRESMEALAAELSSVSSRSVDEDICRHVASELSRDRRLSRLEQPTKTLIKETLSRKADGMFRWVGCQLRELKKLKSKKPSYIEQALLQLPATLDETYERILNGIEEMYHSQALTLLRWLVYAQSPLNLGELTEAAAIRLEGGGHVDVDDRGDLEDVLHILSGLVVTVHSNYNGDITDGNFYKNTTEVRLAHFSVKEYLESKRILKGGAKAFHFESGKEHRLLSRSCITYILHYSGSSDKESDLQDLVTFPLLQYAARSWFIHSSLQLDNDVSHEISLLSSDTAKSDWLLIYRPDAPLSIRFVKLTRPGSALYYASLLGLEKVVVELLRTGCDVSAPGGIYSNALWVASANGFEKIVQALLDGGTDINARGLGDIGENALDAASSAGHENIVQTLIDRGADVNAKRLGTPGSSALEEATFKGHNRIVQMLKDRGARW